MFILAFAFVLTICGTTAAATPSQSTTINTHNNTTANSIATNNTNHNGDPIINGTVTINRYDNGTYYPVQGATITVNSTGTNSRVLGTTTTDQNGNYYINFYNNATQFLVTASYMGCNSTTSTVNVALNSTDGLYYGTSNFKLAPNTAVLQSMGDLTKVWVQYYNAYEQAGVINVQINGVSYTSYCIDIYTEIGLKDTLYVNGPLPGTTGSLPTQDNWAAVNYIIKNYSPTSNTEAAAIQCAIWYFTSAQYGVYPGNNSTYPGRYQFMTCSTDGQTTGNGTAVRTAALSIISAANAASIPYPTNVTLQPGTTRVPNGGTSTLTATVTDQNGNPISGVTILFNTNKGSLSTTTGTTNALGQISTTLSGVASSTSATVNALVNGTYGSLLYDNPSNPLQNLVCTNILPYTLSASSTVNFDLTANVTLSQTVTTPVNVGNTVTYTITAHNNGNSTGTGILINDIAPSGLTNVVITPSSGTTYANGVWTIPSLVNSGSATLTISGTVVSSMAGTNTANTATRTAEDQYNGMSPTSTISFYTKKASLTITNTGTTPVNVGGTGTFTITATNNGPDPATNIQINDPLPTRYTAGTPTAGTYNQTTGIWTITSLANGSQATLTFTAPITATMAGTTTTNHATATWTEYPTTVTIPDSTIHVNKAGLTITNTGTTPVNVGGTGTFTITATNNGPDPATNIQINDPLPTGYTAGTPTAGTYNQTTGIWTITSLANGSQATLTFTAPITATMAGTTTTNHATATWTEYPTTVTIPDSTIHVNKAGLTITNTGTTPVNVGGTGTFTITATNNGPDPATNIQINDPLPTGYTAGTPTAGTYNQTTGIWTITSLANGSQATLTFTAPITATMAGTTTTNHATATWTEYPTTVTIPDSTIHVNKAGLTITNTGTTPVNVGGTGTFTITATNNGPDPATNIQINDPLPTGYTAGTPTAGTYNQTTGIWTITSLANGSQATLTFTTPITATMAGTTTTNHATATWTEYPTTVTIPDSSIYVKQANVAISQTGNYSGNNVTFIVTATNKGPDTATNININDLIPSGLTGVTVTPSVGSYNSTTGIWTIDNLINGATATLNITGTAVPQSIVSNTATRTSQTEYNDQPNTSLLRIYVPDVNIAIYNYPWWYNANTKSQQYTYVVGNAPVLTTDIWNNGPDDATGVIIEYDMGSGLQYEGNSADQGTVTYNSNNNSLTWNLGTIPSGGDVLLKIFVRIIQSGTATPNLTTTSQLIHVDQYDNTYPSTKCALSAPTGADIQVNQTQNNYTGTDGKQYITYTITTTNNGPDTATGVTITDKLPTGLTYISDTSQGTYNPTTGTWTIGTLTNQNTTTITITAQITATSGTIHNTATKTNEDQYDPNYANDAQTCTHTISGTYTPTSNISIYNYPWWYNANTKSQQYTYVVGNAPVLTTDIWNNGPDDATGVIIEYDMGSGLQYEGNSADQGTVTYNSNNNSLTWNLGTIPSGGDVLLKIFVRIIQSGTATPNLTTTSQLIHVDQYDNTYPSTKCALSAPTGADIQVNQTQNNYTGTDGKQYITYTITTTNNGPDTATGVTITDKLPTGLTYISDTSQGTYNPTTGTWTIGTLTNQNTTTITITAQITATSGTIHNTATKTNEDQYDPNYANDAQTQTLTIQ